MGEFTGAPRLAACSQLRSATFQLARQLSRPPLRVDMKYRYLPSGDSIGQPSAAAVLIRALQPTHGLAAMRRRRGLEDERALCSGPGKLASALAITNAQNGLALTAPPFAIHARTFTPEIATGVRIGITKAAELPWRYGLKGSRFVSKPF